MKHEHICCICIEIRLSVQAPFQVAGVVESTVMSQHQFFLLEPPTPDQEDITVDNPTKSGHSPNFVRGHSPNCTFCDVLEIPEEHNETPLHLFYQCTAVEYLTNEIFSWLLDSQVEISRHELFTIFNRDDFRKNDFLTIFSKLLLKYYWDCKQRSCIPTLQNAKIILRGELEVLVQCNAKIRTIHANSGINFNRE